jgi:hypothetical protein
MAKFGVVICLPYQAKLGWLPQDGLNEGDTTRNDKCIQRLTVWGKDDLANLSADNRIILKWMLKKWGGGEGRRVAVPTGSGQGPVWPLPSAVWPGTDNAIF